MMKKTKIYAEILETEALEQFNTAMSLPCNISGALMPDAHTGYTLPIGAVIKSDKMIFPAYVGYDIGCGMCAVKLDITKENLDLKSIKESILEVIPHLISVITSLKEKNIAFVSLIEGMDTTTAREELFFHIF